MSTICLNMIVKNERDVIVRCLESVKPILSTWVIVDTGSTDGTQDVIRECLRDLPGELHQRPWKNFGHNRTEAMELARGKADYLFVCDADDVLLVPPGFLMPVLVADSYQIKVEGVVSHFRTHFFRSDLDFHYVGVLHEYPHSNEPRSSERLQGLIYRIMTGSARSRDPDKFLKDAAVLEQALVEEPENARHVFYLAQSWRDAGVPEKAIAAYERRVAMGGWEEEVYCSLQEIAHLLVRLGRKDDEVVGAFLRAFEYRPRRAEPMCEIATFLRLQGRVKAGYPFAKVAAEIPRPDETLFLDESVYAWRSLDELAVAAYWVGHRREAFVANERLLAEGRAPTEHRERIEQNLAFCRLLG